MTSFDEDDDCDFEINDECYILDFDEDDDDADEFGEEYVED